MAKTKTVHKKKTVKSPQQRLDESVVFPSGWEPNMTCPLCGEQANSQANQGMDDPIDGVSVKHWQDTFNRIEAQNGDFDDKDHAPCRRCLVVYGMERAGRAGEDT